MHIFKYAVKKDTVTSQILFNGRNMDVKTKELKKFMTEEILSK